MANIASCFNCLYAYYDREHALALWDLSVGVLAWPACANQPDFPGRMQRVPERGICRNYRPRPATPEGDVKQISVGDGTYAYVDAADFDWLNRWTWSLYGGYAARREKKKLILMHRAIMQSPAGMVVDHKNRNKLDNTRDNLWNTTPKENARNRRKRRDASSRFMGVYYHRQHGKWYVKIWFEGERIPLGYFTDEVEAARAYDRGAVAYLGDAALLNFPKEWPPARRAQVYAGAKEQRRRISARTKPGGKQGGKTTSGEKPCSAGRKKAATKGKRSKPASGRNQNRSSRQDAKNAKKKGGTG